MTVRKGPSLRPDHPGARRRAMTEADQRGARGLPMDGAAPPDNLTTNSAAPTYLGYAPIYLGIVVVNTTARRLRHRREPSMGAPRPRCRSGGGASPGSGQLRTQRELGLLAGVGAAIERLLELCRPDRVAHPARGQR